MIFYSRKNARRVWEISALRVVLPIPTFHKQPLLPFSEKPKCLPNPTRVLSFDKIYTLQTPNKYRNVQCILGYGKTSDRVNSTEICIGRFQTRFFFFYYIGTYMFLQKSEEKLRKTWKGHYEKIYMSIYNYIRVVIPKEEKGKFNLKARH